MCDYIMIHVYDIHVHVSLIHYITCTCILITTCTVHAQYMHITCIKINNYNDNYMYMYTDNYMYSGAQPQVNSRMRVRVE